MSPGKGAGKALRASALAGALGKKAPQDLAEEWDNVGFLAGDADAEVRGVVVAVNLGREALDEARRTGANFIACHHPPIFKPVSRLTKASNPFLFEALSHGIGVMALHTNFDLSSGAMNRRIAQLLGCSHDGALAPRGGDGTPGSVAQGKFITCVPEGHVDAVREAVAKAGGGVIGNYAQCSFSWEGEGTFLGGPGSHPTVGRVGHLEKARERRLEMVFPWRALTKVVDAALKAHPYEEVAYDVIRLENPARDIGYGFVGDYEQGVSFSHFLRNVKAVFQLDGVTVVHDQSTNGTVKRVAFSPGSGSAFVHAAIAKGVDAYVCGEVGYHHMLDAKRAGLSLVVLGHSYSERFFVEQVAEWCRESLDGAGANAAPVSKVFEVVETLA